MWYRRFVHLKKSIILVELQRGITTGLKISLVLEYVLEPVSTLFFAEIRMTVMSYRLQVTKRLKCTFKGELVLFIVDY